jgi:hypothetical protein
MRIILLTLIVFNFLSLSQSYCQRPSVNPRTVNKYVEKNKTKSDVKEPSVYPGATKKYLDGSNTLLTRDSYEKVKDYYQKEIGRNPQEDSFSPGSGCSFVYVPRKPDPDAVFITLNRGYSRATSSVFSELGKLVFIGVLSQDRFDEIQDQYNYVSKCYYDQVKDENGEITTRDDMVYQKYRHKAGLGGTESIHEVMEQAQELMMQGRRDEGTEMMRKATENLQKGIEKSRSADAVDIWIECLDELASVAYPIEIRLQVIRD